MEHSTTQASSFRLYHFPYYVQYSCHSCFFLVENLLNSFLVLFPHIFSPLLTIPVLPMVTGTTKHFVFHIHWILLKFSFLIHFHPPFVLYSYRMVLLRLSISEFYVLFLITVSDLLARTSLFESLDSIVSLYLHVYIPPEVYVNTSFLLFWCQ